MRIVVCGGGVVGAAVAYHLARRGHPPRVFERTGVACAASGKSGGFLARDWCDGSPLGPLARASFDLHRDLHRELAATRGAGWGYRAVETLLVAQGGHSAGALRPDRAPGWLDGDARVRGVLGTPASTAQVHPERFTRALMDAALAGGAELVRGAVEDLVLAGGRLEGVVVEGTVHPAEAAVLALGPWTGRLAGRLRGRLALPPVHGLKGNSVVLRPPVGEEAVPAQALFVETTDPRAGTIAPEVYPRPDGEVYVCGMADELPLPADAGAVAPSPAACAALERVARGLSSRLARAETVRVQACYRPVAADGLPLLGPVPGAAGLYLATGHSCWGILNAPASGAALAELIVDGASRRIDLAPFHPGRFL